MDEKNELVKRFMQQFACKEENESYINQFLFMQSSIDSNEVNVENEVHRRIARYAKRGMSVANQFRNAVDQLRSCEDIRCADSILHFLLTYADSLKVRRSHSKNVKRSEANSKLPRRLSDSNDSLRCPNEDRLREGSKVRFVAPEASCASAFPNKLDMFADSGSSDTTQHFGDVKSFPVLPAECKTPKPAVDSFDLTRQLLAALQGIEGVFFTRKHGSQSSIIFNDEYCVSDSQRGYVNRLLVLANCFDKLQYISARTEGKDSFTQAFLSCIPDLTSDYANEVSDLYAKLLNCPSSVSLLAITFALRQYEIQLPLLLKFAESSEKMDGIEILNSALRIFWSSSVIEISSCIESVLKRMLDVFLTKLSDWLIHGNVFYSTSSLEWMIVSYADVQDDQAWSMRYKVVEKSVPIFLRSHKDLVEKILITGKCVALMHTIHMEDRKLNTRRSLLMRLNDVSCFYIHCKWPRIAKVIKIMCKEVSSEFFDRICNQFNLYSHFNAIGRHYLLTYEIFAFTLYEKLRKIVEEQRYLKGGSHAFGLAFMSAMTACNSWPPDVSELATLDANCVVVTEMNVNGEWTELPTPRDIYGNATAELRYNAKLPISIIFSHDIMRRYQRIFQFMWSLSSADFRLSSVAEKQASYLGKIAKFFPDMRITCRLFSYIFREVEFTIKTLRNYVLMNIVGSSTEKFNSNMRNKCGNIDQLNALHDAYLLRIEEGLFLTNVFSKIRVQMMMLFESSFEVSTHYSNFLTAAMERRSQSVTNHGNDKGHSHSLELSETARFLVDEEYMSVQEELKTAYYPVVCKLKLDFRCLMVNLMKELLKYSSYPTIAELALQLDLQSFYLSSAKSPV
ncbi:hypothetical protein AB6A40_000226 [Gnathostoma spinigerum]|uniref:Gamma-tubulin complex component n=1 Tax=Gnathostoma spinigerum TaxID=75299 RepID=A0ABD6EA13_9BILA